MEDYRINKMAESKENSVNCESISKGIGDKFASKDINEYSYSKETRRIGYDRDEKEIAEISRFLNNMAPIRMPIYNFNIDELNGEHYYRPDGTLLLIREYDSEVIRDYYASKKPLYENVNIYQILEHNKNTGILKVKIEPIIKNDVFLKINVIIFDEKINGKYILLQLSRESVVESISEFSSRSKAFKTLFRNVHNSKPARYLEGRESTEKDFEMVDCLFDNNGNIARIKRYSNNKKVAINYTENTKNTTVTQFKQGKLL